MASMLFLATWFRTPDHGSGVAQFCKSSIENLTSLPFSMRDSGSALRSQWFLVFADLVSFFGLILVLVLLLTGTAGDVLLDVAFVAVGFCFVLARFEG